MSLDSVSGRCADLKLQEEQANLQEELSGSGRKRSNGKIGWQKKVYKINEDESDALLEFHNISQDIFKRDEFKCQSCLLTRYKLSREDRFLTCHHILPRAEGGTNDRHNLITLCNICHDKIEELTLRSAAEICGYFSEEKRHWTQEKNIGAKWQEWVYGGKKRPK